jgi:multiple sugar transport system substrate-binding protein
MNTRNLLPGFILLAAWAWTPAPAQERLSLWLHAGPGPEQAACAASIDAFNRARKDVQVDLTVLPEGSYNDQVRAAALAGQLPSVLELDGPLVASYAWAGKLLPLDGFTELQGAVGDLLPTLARQGTFRGRRYTLGQYESGLALWGSRRLLARAGVRIPERVDQAWDLDEFEDALGRLQRSGIAHPLDMKLNYGVGEWYTFAFAPIVQSFGGDLIERKDGRTAHGALDGPEAVEAMTRVQAWVKAGFVDPSNRDDAVFAKGQAALSYAGHWTWPACSKAPGDDLVLIPMPRFGARAVTGAGSWSFGIAADCRNPQAAARLLAYLLSPPEIARITAANGAVPGTYAALKASRAYGAGGPLSLYADQLAQGLGVVRPETPAYPVISSAFAEAVNNILAGSSAKDELEQAVGKIDEEIGDNHGYPDL